MFEDAPNDVETAIKTRMQVVLVLDDTTDRELCKRATLLLNSLEEFKPEMFGLPPSQTEGELFWFHLQNCIWKS